MYKLLQIKLDESRNIAENGKAKLEERLAEYYYARDCKFKELELVAKDIEKLNSGINNLLDGIEETNATLVEIEQTRKEFNV